VERLAFGYGCLESWRMGAERGLKFKDRVLKI
jgi:hypothetical protein